MPNAHGHTVREQESVCVVDLAGRVANLEQNLARGLSWIEKAPARPGRLAIVGSGPSVRSRLDVIKAHDEIWAVNGAYDFLLSEGIVPQGFWGIDPLPGLAEYVGNARAETTFYIAASCDPSVFESLAGHKVCLWFPNCEDMIYPAGAPIVNGGVTVITRTPFAAAFMGWRDITMFGADSSFDEEAERRYCYQDGTFAEDSKADLQFVQVGEETFITEGSLLKQVANLGVMAEQFAGRLKFDCDGLLKAYLASPMHDIDGDGAVTGPNAEWFYGSADAA